MLAAKIAGRLDLIGVFMTDDDAEEPSPSRSGLIGPAAAVLVVLIVLYALVLLKID
ncbi:hypothetical protein [Methylobacterium haplocladii]|uniref:hypothetical protein n=1 Tax=Methylobacterium haplocladii TaxID=1176176 RepID=UPI001AEDC7DA|nr:hypothetical protein [Methylobacterium haplocladii]